MSDLIIRSSLADRLRQIAQQRNQPVEEFLENLLDTAHPQASKDITLAELAVVARRVNLRGGPTDITDRSRDVINESYAKRSTRWMNDDTGLSDG